MAILIVEYDVKLKDDNSGKHFERIEADVSVRDMAELEKYREMLMAKYETDFIFFKYKIK